jgi:pfkB family carbohydrate kinase
LPSRLAAGYARRVIVVVGDPTLHPSGGVAPALAGGMAAAVARACARAGAAVQLAGKVGDDPPGDEILLALTGDGIGHVALLRDAGTATRIGEPTVSSIATGPRAGAASDDEWTVALAGDDDDPAEEDGSNASTDPAAGVPRAAPAPASSLAPEDLDLALRYLASFTVLIVAQPLGPATLAVAVESAAYAGAHLILIDAPDAVASVPVDDLTALESPGGDPDGDFAGLVGRYAAALDAGTAAAAAFRSALGAAGWEAAIP